MTHFKLFDDKNSDRMLSKMIQKYLLEFRSCHLFTQRDKNIFYGLFPNANSSKHFIMANVKVWNISARSP